MTGIPPPTNSNQSLIQAINDLSNQVGESKRASEDQNAILTGTYTGFQRQLQLSLKSTIVSLQSLVNPIDRLRDSFRRVDETNRLALKQGINTVQLKDAVNQNSEVFKNNLVSNQKLIEAIVMNTDSGIRLADGAFMDLTQEMIATGADLTGLRTATMDLLFFTGENTKAVQSFSETNKEVSDKYGVSNERLIQSVNSLRDVMQEASFFGGETTASLANLTQTLTARTGGKDAQGAIRALLQLGTGGAGNIGASILTGATGFRARVAAGQQVGMQDVLPILDRISEIAGASRGIGGSLGLGADVAAARTGLSKENLNQLLALREQLRRNFELDENVKADEDDRYKTLANLNEKAANFYDNTAMNMLNALNGINMGLLSAGIVGAQGAGLLSSFKKGPVGQGGYTGILSRINPMSAQNRAAIGQMGKAQLAARGGVGLGVGLLGGHLAGMAAQELGMESTGGLSTGLALGSTLGSVIPGIGTLAGGLAGAGIGLLYDIAQNTGETSEEAKKQRMQEEEEIRRRRAEEASRDMGRLEFLAGYIRSRGGSFMSDPEMLKAMQQFIIEQKKTRTALQSSNKTTGVGRK